MGLLTGFAFAVFYAGLGIPVARWADRGNRKLVVTLSLVVWSTFTIFSGFALTFWLLALARIGVGAGEAGAVPPSQSLLADYFPAERRGTVLAIFMSSATLGYLIAFMGGGPLAQHYGWRTALILVGAPGLGIAVLSWLVLDEPRSRQAAGNAPPTSAADHGLWHALMELASKRSYLWLLGGIASYGLVAYGSTVFYASFMVRSLGVTLSRVGIVYGAVSACVALSATLAGGWVADRIASKDSRWYAWLPALTCALALPFHVAGLLAHSFGTFLALTSVGTLFIGLGFSSMFTSLHAICGSSRRSLAVAVFTFAISLIGSGFGPLITGSFSDVLAPILQNESLRYAMIAANFFLIPSAWFFYMCGRTMLDDLEA
jgi:MFS family permease